MEKKSEIRFINSPFFVTVIGSLFITVLTLTFQFLQSNYELRNAEDLKKFEAKQELIKDFTHDFAEALIYALRYKEREIWISKNYKNETKNNFNDGRTFDETIIYYEKMQDQYYQMNNPNTLLSQISFMFNTKEVLDKTKDLEKKVDEFIIVKNNKKLYELYSEIGSLYDELVNLLENEIKEVEKGSEKYEK